MKQMDINNYIPDTIMNREQRRALAKAKQKWISTLPDVLTLVPDGDPMLPYSSHAEDLECVWRSKKYQVMVWKRQPKDVGSQLSISRQQWDPTARRYLDGISWDEIMQIKREMGLGQRTCIEYYPPDSETINLANTRHIWLLPDGD